MKDMEQEHDDQNELHNLFASERLEDILALAISTIILILVLMFF